MPGKILFVTEFRMKEYLLNIIYEYFPSYFRGINNSHTQTSKKLQQIPIKAMEIITIPRLSGVF
jgi:hypothetical protein